MSDLEVENYEAVQQDHDLNELDAERGGDAVLRAAQGVSINGVRIGALVGFIESSHTPLVVFPGQRGSAAVPARATLDVHGAHVGRDTVLMFEDADPGLPIILGFLPRNDSWPVPQQPGTVQVDAEGERMIVGARKQLVLQCGKASITMTSAGKILIQGEYVSTVSTGVNRVKGGSVQIN